MGLFQHSVLTKYLKEANQDEIKSAWEKLVAGFSEQKQKALALKSEIDRTDREIDRMVYELYRLTEEEIRVVEERQMRQNYNLIISDYQILPSFSKHLK